MPVNIVINKNSSEYVTIITYPLSLKRGQPPAVWRTGCILAHFAVFVNIYENA